MGRDEGIMRSSRTSTSDHTALSRMMSAVKVLSTLAVGLFVAACTASIPSTLAPTASPTATASLTPSSRAETPIAPVSPSPTPIPLPSFALIGAPSGDVVWALVAGSRLFVSTDRGDSWQEREIPQRDVPNLDVSFISATEGWAMSAGSPATQCQSQLLRVWRTADGAKTWTVLRPAGIPDAQCKQNLSFLNADSGFISAWDQNHVPTTLQTTDGGTTWRAVTIPGPPGFTTQAGGVSLQAGHVRYFGPAAFVEAYGQAGGARHGYVFVWQSNAPGWAYLATLPNSSAAFAFAGDSGGGDLRWLLIAPGGTSQESTDSGRTWHPFTTNYQQAAPIAPGITFADGKVGYATVRGTIQRTTDGGAHWGAMKTPGTLSP